ncbi:SPFH domain-containing protein [Flammeovirgaceae bacterium SG7u.111]|nr:SPFH domain-containing protein [Flammeovirgaceae bacterium SG7u.132]WPO35559.1 SPFH domain-containing protein [Flammeovirgaceae bacterium SG7u.111]
MQTEKKLKPASGFTFIIIHLLIFASALACFYTEQLGQTGIVILLVSLVLFRGYFTVQLNEASVLTFFGEYKGSVKKAGFYWGNPFMSRTKLSLKLHSCETEKLTLPDQNAELVEIGASIVWKIQDSYLSLFASDSPEAFIKNQAKICLGELVGQYPYQHFDNATTTTLKDLPTLNSKLDVELSEACKKAGIEISNVKITHLKFMGEPLPSKQQIRYNLLLKKKSAELSIDILESMLHKLAGKKLDLFSQDQRAEFITSTISALCQDDLSYLTKNNKNSE